MIISSRAVRRQFRHVFCRAGLLALALLCSACAEVLIYPANLEPRSELDRSTAPGIVERGLGFPVALVADGYKGEKLVVRTFDSAQVFLGDTIVVPDGDSTRWSKLSLFAPYSKLFNSADPINHLVMKPGHDDAYISRMDRLHDRWKPEHAPSTVWAVREVDLNAALESGPGVRIRADLFIRGMVGKTPELFVHLIDDQGTIVGEGVPGPRLNPVGHNRSVYENLLLEVPYRVVSGLPPTKRLDAVPRVRLDDVWQPPNVWIAIHAGGAVNSQLRQVAAEMASLDAAILEFERMLQLLEASK